MSILSSPDKILYEAHERPSWPMLLLLAVTHVILIFDAVVFIPNVLGKVTDAPAEEIRFACFMTILVSAVGTLVQTLRVGKFGTGFILFMGSYSAYLACSLDAARMGGLELLATMSLLSAPVVFLYSRFLSLLRHIVTPVVGGVVIMLVALNLISIALPLWHGGSPGDPGYGSWQNWVVGVATMTSLLFLMIFGNRKIRLWTPLLGLFTGYLTAAMLGILHLENFHSSPLVGLPPMAWPGLTLDLNWMHLPLAVAFIITALSSSIEGTGNIMLVQSISRRDNTISYDRIQTGLYADGMAKALSAVGGGTPVATYCDNIPLIEMTGVASRMVGICGSALLALLAFMPKAGAIILDMPNPVVGGLLIAIAALLFHAGVGLATQTELTGQTGLLLGVSMTVGLVAESDAFFPELMPEYLAPLLQNGVALGGFTAFVLSLLIHLAPKPKRTFSVDATPESLPLVMAELSSLARRLRLDDSTTQRLKLACEETLVYLSSGSRQEQGNILFKIVRTEEGLFTEAIMAGDVTEVVNIDTPGNLMIASDEELDQLGLYLLGKVARNIRHICISRVNYISFLI